MKTVTYLLHRFPRVTDTFIMREIESLGRAGTEVRIISVWKPLEHELLAEWVPRVIFLLPDSIRSVVIALCAESFGNPKRFLLALRTALQTSPPGLRGFAYQMFYLAEALLAASHIRANRTSHLHNHFGDRSGTVTMLAAILTTVDYSISFHGPHVFFDEAGSSLKEKIRNACFIRSISYFCRSQLMVAAQSTDITRNKIIHCGIDLEKYPFSQPSREVTTIFCAARLAPEKGIEFLLQAFRVVAEVHNHIRLRIAGGGSSRSSLEKMAVELGIANRVDFLGQLKETSIIGELCSSDLFVLPSLAEGLPVSLMEAMAVGVPVIATNVAGVSELIENGHNGLLVPPTNVPALAKSILKMIADSGLRTRVAECGRQKVEDEFDIDLETAKLGLMFSEAVNSPSDCAGDGSDV